jgi:hypothetical protein
LVNNWSDDGEFGNYPCSNLEASDMNVNWELNAIKIPTGGFLNAIIDHSSFPIGFAFKPGTFPWKYIPNGLFLWSKAELQAAMTV